MNNEEIVSSVRAELTRIQTFCLSGRRISFSSPDTKEDALLIVESLTVWCGMLLDFSDFSPVFTTGKAAQRGRFRSLIKPAVVGLTDGDFSTGMLFLDNIASSVINWCSMCQSTFKGYHSLKKTVDEIGRESCCHPSLKELIKIALETLDLSDSSPEGDHASALRYFLTITRFLKKLPLDRSDLKQQMEDEYIEDENRLKEVALRLTSRDSSLWWVYSLNALAREVFANFSVEGFFPKHGPGRVATDGVKSTFEKYLDMKDDARINYLLRKHDLGTFGDYCPFELTARSSRTAKYICVPKTWKTLRGISAEPTELQYSQQSVNFCIDNFFRSSPFFRKRVDLHNQSENQRLAKKGSIDQSLATIDLSKASDSVSLTLVKQVFHGTKLLPWLLATRSTSVELESHGIIRTEKFAPMGSSVCFPVECIIFTLIAEVARQTHMRHMRVKTLPIPRVYGDDIVCASSTAPLVLNGLGHLGFLPNKEKSYWSGFYRESCGKEYWCGHDISPLYYRVKGGCLASRTTTYDGITSVNSLYNALYLNGYNTARRVVLSSLKKKMVRLGSEKMNYFDLCVRSFSGENGTLVSSQPTNFNLARKVDRKLNVLNFRIVTWKRTYSSLSEYRLCKTHAQQLLLLSYLERVNYCEWWNLARRGSDEGGDTDNEEVDVFSRVPIGYEMVPQLRGVDSNRFFAI